MIDAEGADPVEICRPPAFTETIRPDPARAERYRGAFQRYRALYPAIKEALRA
jgi:xylulokinase